MFYLSFFVWACLGGTGFPSMENLTLAPFSNPSATDTFSFPSV